MTLPILISFLQKKTIHFYPVIVFQTEVILYLYYQPQITPKRSENASGKTRKGKMGDEQKKKYACNRQPPILITHTSELHILQKLLFF